MKDSLTKSQISWVLIRFLGVYLILQAVLTFCGLVGAALIVGNHFRAIFPGMPSGGDSSYIFTSLFSVAVPASIGIYLLRSGRTLHRLIMTEPEYKSESESEGMPKVARSRPPKKPLDPDDEVDPTTTLTRRQSQAFSRWLSDHPEFQSRPHSDQIALFRDAQNAGEANQ